VIEDVVENYKKAKIPLDVIWNDDDHMDGHKDFTVNPINYPLPKLLSFLERIHNIGMKYIVINDPGIAVNTNYGVYQRGIANDVFIKYEGEPFMAMVWPGAVYFPDFLNPKTVSWWGDEIRRFHELVPIELFKFLHWKVYYSKRKILSTSRRKVTKFYMLLRLYKHHKHKMG
jgi:alpha-D-xyloside xylohydrolase